MEIVFIEKSFIDFIETKEKVGSGLAEEIMNTVEKDGINLQTARGQGYDNGTNIPGKYEGVNSVILQNKK
jgi:hypothetical protein